MSEIVVLYQAPIVFTKDKLWEADASVKPGAIVRLPEDAVLFVPPIIEADQPNTEEGK